MTKIPEQLRGATFIKIRKGGKKPVGKTWQKMDYGQACEYSKKGNVALLCGSDNIRVVDIEGESKGNTYFKELCKILSARETFAVKTPSGGKHYYFWNDEKYDKASYNIDRGGVHCGEYRVRDCYVLVPPSIVGGKKYEED